VGNLETVDVFCRSMTNLARCAVVSVNYRHAPEHKFPIPVEDAYAATQWVATHAAALGGDPARLAVGGTSSGGTQAAVVARLGAARRRQHEKQHGDAAHRDLPVMARMIWVGTNQIPSPACLSLARRGIIC
jgi:acetyl esterase/lipase